MNSRAGANCERVDYANGYKNKTALTRMGQVTFAVPQMRSSSFYPSALERSSRSEQAMNLALVEIYVQGVSTRKIIEVLQKLVGRVSGFQLKCQFGRDQPGRGTAGRLARQLAAAQAGKDGEMNSRAAGLRSRPVRAPPPAAGATPAASHQCR